jgi:hypothetical protein
LRRAENKNASLSAGHSFFAGGRRGIRTPGPLTVNGFQDRRNRPLCHPSGRKIKASISIFKKKEEIFLKAFTVAAFLILPSQKEYLTSWKILMSDDCRIQDFNLVLYDTDGLTLL